MYAMTLNEKEALLELSIEENLNEDELKGMLIELKHFRRKIKTNYRLLIILPNNLRTGSIEEDLKIDFSAFMAKLKGLKHVVLQTPEKNSANVDRLKKIYSELSIRVNITHSFFESQKRLGILK